MNKNDKKKVKVWLHGTQNIIDISEPCLAGSCVISNLVGEAIAPNYSVFTQWDKEHMPESTPSCTITVTGNKGDVIGEKYTYDSLRIREIAKKFDHDNANFKPFSTWVMLPLKALKQTLQADYIAGKKLEITF